MQLLSKVFKIQQLENKKYFLKHKKVTKKMLSAYLGYFNHDWYLLRNPQSCGIKQHYQLLYKCCIILYNIIVHDKRRDTTWDFKYEQIAPVAEIEQQDPIRSFNAFLTCETEMTDQNMHKRLCNDLMEHIWS